MNKSRFTIARRVGLGGAALGAGVALAVLSAPAASAEVTGVSVSPGMGFGATPYGTGCSYEIVAAVNDPNQPVYFRDQDNSWASGAVPVSNNNAKVTWSPPTPGPHTIIAEQYLPYAPYYSVKSTMVQVGNGINLGSSCFVL